MLADSSGKFKVLSKSSQANLTGETDMSHIISYKIFRYLYIIPTISRAHLSLQLQHLILSKFPIFHHSRL